MSDKTVEPIPESNLPYRKIQLTLDNCILPEDVLKTTPSSIDGLTSSDEYELRVIGCELIQSGGILLKLPQVAMATGQVLFHRFYYRKSLVRYPFEITAMACVALASKIEEAPRKIRDVINVFHHLKQLRNKQEIQPMLIDNNYALLKAHVIRAERRLLKELGFCVHIKHPHKFVVTLLQILGKNNDHLFLQTAWNYMNDSLRTDLFVRYTPETIACSCIHLSARVLKICLPENPPWFQIFGAELADVEDVCIKILQLYSIGKCDKNALEQRLQILKEKLESQRVQSKIDRQDNSNVTTEQNSMDINQEKSLISNDQSSKHSFNVPLKKIDHNDANCSQEKYSANQSNTHKSNPHSGSDENGSFLSNSMDKFGDSHGHSTSKHSEYKLYYDSHSKRSDRDRDTERSRDRERDKERDRDRDKPRDRERERDRERDRETRDRDRERDRERDPRDKDHERSRDRSRDRTRERNRYRRSNSRDKEDRSHRKNKDKEREHEYESERKRMKRRHKHDHESKRERRS